MATARQLSMLFVFLIWSALLCSLRNNKPVFVPTLCLDVKCVIPAPRTPMRTVLSYMYICKARRERDTQTVTLYQFVLLMGMWGGRAIQSVSVSCVDGGSARVLQLGEQIIVRAKFTSRTSGGSKARVYYIRIGVCLCVGDPLWAQFGTFIFMFIVISCWFPACNTALWMSGAMRIILYIEGCEMSKCLVCIIRNAMIRRRCQLV